MGAINKRIDQAGQNDRRCIWEKAGVVRKKYCGIDYKCHECRFDMVMRRAAHENLMAKESGSIPPGKKGKIVLWKERLRSKPITKRPCIHHMKERIEFRACTNEYRCPSCDFDQYFHDQFSVHAVVNPVDVLGVKGFKIPQGYYFHRGHTWAKIEEGSSVIVGIDDFALSLMGPLDRIETPLMGKVTEQGRPDISVARGINRAHLLSPVSGIITAINPFLREEGNIANKAPYSEGWVMRVESDSLRQDLKQLMINTETGEYIDGQVEQLYKVIEETGGPLAADGGYLGKDIFGGMPELGWERLVSTFL